MPDDTEFQAPAIAEAIASGPNSLTELRRELAPSLRIMLDERLYEQVKRLAGIMSKDAIFTPKHLVGKAEACFTVITQAIQWNIDPHFVARSTYQTPGGSIGFEGKLVQAILEQSGRFIGAPTFEYVGDWNRVLGKFQKATSQHGKEYVRPTWTEKDAIGLGVIVRWQARGEPEPRVWPGPREPFQLTQCFPLNSPLWATDPKTQIAYLAIRRFATNAAPGILGGMPFDVDQLVDASEMARDITPRADGSRRMSEADLDTVTEVVEAEDAPSSPEDVAETSASTPEEEDAEFAVVDHEGNETKLGTPAHAFQALIVALDQAAAVGSPALEGVIESNKDLVDYLDSIGEHRMTRDLRDQVMALRARLAPKPEQEVMPDTSNAPAENMAQPQPAAQPTGASAPIGSSAEWYRGESLELKPPMRNGKPHWPDWLRGRFQPRLKGALDNAALARLLGDNEKHIEDFKRAEPASAHMLDAMIALQWQQVQAAS